MARIEMRSQTEISRVEQIFKQTSDPNVTLNVDMQIEAERRIARGRKLNGVFFRSHRRLSKL